MADFESVNITAFIRFLLRMMWYAEAGILYPRMSKTRDVLSLDGLWKFDLSNNGTSDSNEGLTGSTDDKDVHWMPVPASYNDIPTTFDAREHTGEVRYERTFRVPEHWRNGNKIWLRFGSVCYSAKVYINGELAMSHEIGHLPFKGEITSFLNDDENSITVIVDNTLTSSTVPQGSFGTLPGGRKKQYYTFDFFNYAGIDRPVNLYTTPSNYIDDITIQTKISKTSGIVKYKIDVEGDGVFDYKVTVLDKEKKAIVSNTEDSGDLDIENAHLWWPYLMNDEPGYLYTLRVDLLRDGVLVDRYEQPFGIRDLAWDSTSFKINGQPIYFRGFGRHEDSDIRGKGLDLPLIIRDYNLIKWIGANSYRTSHYPYAEEIMDLADSLGIMIIDEVPAVNTEDYNDGLLENHKRALTELYKRDKNRPSVVVWSVANEPRTQLAESEQYYEHVTAHIRSLDLSRPITIANMYSYNVDHSGKFLDILSFNQYNAWYQYAGELDVIVPDIVQEAEGWHLLHNKPVMITEYGGDTLEGFHALPNFIWSEEFQVGLLSQHFKAFDQLREKGWFIGELIWNFADFKTEQATTRVGGNKKGIFTRQRQPKASAHFMRKRYWALAETLNNVTKPTDLEGYVIKMNDAVKTEL